MIRRWLIRVAFYVSVTAVMVNPIANLTELRTASYEGDARLIIWTLAWDNHALLTGHPLFDSNIFHPSPGSLAYNEHLFGLSLFTLPIYAATDNPVLAYNVVWLLSFILNGIAAHALLRRLTGSDLAAATGSLIYTFSFYKMLHGHGHLHLVWTWPIPLSVLCLERWRDRPTLPRAFAWAIAVILQVLTSWYLAVMAILVQGIVVAGVLPALWRQRRLRQVWHLATVTALAVAVIWPFAAPYRTLPPADTREVASHSADLTAYLMPPENTWLGQQWLARAGPGPRWVWGEKTVSIGWVALVLAMVGVWALVTHRRWPTLLVFLTMTLVALVLSFGPPRGHADGSWNLFAVLSAMPGLGAFRAPARFALLVLFGVSVFAAFGAQLVSARVPRGPLVVTVLLPLMLSEWYLIGFPGGQPRPFEVPQIYRASALANARAIVSLPDYRATPSWFLGGDYLYFSTAHWRPVVNGFGRTEPRDHARVVSHMRAFPGPNNAQTMRKLGVEFVVFHAARHPNRGRRILHEAAASPEYEQVARIGDDYLFKVRARPLPVP